MRKLKTYNLHSHACLEEMVSDTGTQHVFEADQYPAESITISVDLYYIIDMTNKQLLSSASQ